MTPMNCIETSGLTYRFSSRDIILNNLNIQVPVGSIYGFLGPNGAGKTTTLRLLLGLLKNQEGTIRIYNEELHSNRTKILSKIGSLIESPSIYGHLTAYENLLVFQKIYRCPLQRITEVLKLVGLENTGTKKARKFSLGMKQRLSIAMALLHNPSLLILDEPTNGLDPYGILEIRELLKKLNREEGITIVISSHLLSEIEKLVTHLGIINHGKLLFQGTLDELTNLQKKSSFIAIDTSDNEKAMAFLDTMGINSESRDGKICIDILSKEKMAGINRQLLAAGIDVSEITISKNDLEALFMNLINQA
jgi:lantibiotic transport system ATP-binding protein